MGLMKKALEGLMQKLISSYVKHQPAFKNELALTHAGDRTLAVIVTDDDGKDEPQTYFFYVEEGEALKKVAQLPQKPTTTMILPESILLKCVARDLPVADAYWAGMITFEGIASIRDAHIIIDWFSRIIQPDVLKPHS